jgi:carbon monoxide dehydrogenase subunit G
MSTLFLLLASAVGLSDGEFSKALAGDVPVHTETFASPSGKSAGRGVGAIVIERPIAEVWTHLSRYEDKAEYQPRVKSVTILEKLADRIRARFVVDATIMTAKYTAWFVFDPAAHVIHWTLDDKASDNTIVAADGDYRMFEVEPGKTLVVYRTYIDSGRAIAASIQNYFTRKAIPDLLKAVKKRIESGGTWKK